MNKEIINDKNLILPIWLDLDVKEVYKFSPLLVDKLAISINSNEIDIAITKIEKKINIEHTRKETIREKINLIVTFNDDRRNKYFLDLEKRIRSIFLFQQEYYNWYISDDTFNDKNEWDELLVAQKEQELKLEYKIPIGVWTNPEPFEWNAIERAIKLCSKWIFRKLAYQEAEELYFLLEELLDTDLHFILYGFTHFSIVDKNAYEESINGIFEIGIKNSAKRSENSDDYNKALSYIFDKYYGK